MSDNRKQLREWKATSNAVCKVCDGVRPGVFHNICASCRTWVSTVYHKIMPAHYYKEERF